MNHRSHVSGGFSLVELMVAIGIVATLLLLIVGIFTLLIHGSQKASDLTKGSVIADGLLSQQIYQVMSVDATRIAFFQQSCPTPAVFQAGTCALNGVVYAYKIYCQDIPLNVALNNPDTNNAVGLTPLKRLDVVVWWNDVTADSAPNGQQMIIGSGGAEQGMQQVHQVRVLWPNSAY